MPTLKLSDECFVIAEDVRSEGATLGDLVKRVGPKGAAFFALLFSIPFILWIAFPGLSLLFSVILIANGVQIVCKKNVWLPAFLAKKKLSGD